MKKFLGKKLVAAFLITVAAGFGTVANAAEKVTVFAAASMKDVIEEAAKQIKAKDGTEVVASFASSSVLAKQIEQGAPAQIFISADLDWMDYVEKADTIDKASRKIIAGNALVIAAQKETPKGEAKDLLGAGRFAMGDPSNVPAGKYGKAALEKLDLWKDVEKNAVFAENVRVALQYVSRAEVKAAIVYASDRAAAPELVEAYRFPVSSHAPILYPAALIAKNESDAARAFLAFLESDVGQAIIKDKGFVAAAEAAQ
ncbi:molybdate ABC transporter substrate-binding protein [Brucellaceae bacterium D45D]